MKRTITLAAGCFWGTQAYFDRQPGIITTTVGYANGHQPTVTYDELCQNETGFVEACQITFDETIISLAQLLTKYWQIIDPTLVNQQGNDVGSQYRTGIYYDQADETWAQPIILKSRDEIAKYYQKPIATEIRPLSLYVLAEEYHQKYLEKNPTGYCHIDLTKG
ncbi:peptide-methionine (S)-S-oxide reductase MsrA [Spiroplasma sp. SV19]|uniref:peptide-methionine (S)-S-oxide reductase MsrA n=1 Tax=Spiroplasma sp. SV19 TaxID=2570468 RepID=UPI0024B84C3E|nr:peptide-methionine (S)-S-oxide reductase MsrA [Spiroplasma sp. SV19]WHQ36671.1 peptide-methionine (S)-S-oxide reductase MsrA [Spiroplasma sp. SV19]